ncbi:MAG: DUF1559 domain-containing protein [Rhodopirellula sp. JB044]|uniref:DUF1559 family PulG-like putative transporter n=1 Tax=Rhodopirellula sp. JB044 TaxID=3342844 RepID=UPI00370C2447
MKTKKRVEGGFTLVELLVVISIIAVLVGLLIPAVQAAREAARRMQCSNHVRQFGLAIHNYHSAYQVLPRALWFETPPKSFNGRPWSVAILPFMEQQAIYDQFDMNVVAVDQLSPRNVAVIQSVVPLYVCPSTPESADTRRYTFDATAMGMPFTATNIAPIDYTPTTGVNGNYMLHAGIDGSIEREGALQVVSSVFGGGQDGSFAGILDGLSNTFLLGERTGGPTIYSGGRVDNVATANLVGTNGGGWGDLVNGEHWMQGSQRDGLSWPPEDGPCAINCTNARGFGFHSFHPGGSYFLLADGSVKFFTENIEPYLFASMITRRGREVPRP